MASSNANLINPLLDMARGRLSGKRVIALVSGKGGVGKTTLSAIISLALARSGRSVSLFDLDIHGVSAYTIFGINEVHEVSKLGIEPIRASNVYLFSIAGIVGKEPIVLPGENKWGVLLSFVANANIRSEYVVFDMPPGMSDELLLLRTLTPFKPIVVTTPSSLSTDVALRLTKWLDERGSRPHAVIINMANLYRQQVSLGPYPHFTVPWDPGIEDFIGRIAQYDGPVMRAVEGLVATL